MEYRLDDLPQLGAQIAPMLRVGDVIGLSGDLGAGKTSLARAILMALGLVGEAPSPSFAIVQPYGPPEISLNLLHIDLYRIKNQAELAELGLEDALHDHVLLIEWPEILGADWGDMLHLRIDFFGDDGALAPARRLTVDVPPAWEGRWRLAI
ncbi:MAG: tRNA (adenosine(37)-N6)-threonylcarbamoyltransferase complex ATPase subunit type 1 TsaE [Sphingomonadaceae bacterium]|nr:tRNA (adenosine(37)-N6)-threonylcarbamoyltransferase complex ATPase subunit type 1 TsaE [Sphingomonadaceae bacterium]